MSFFFFNATATTEIYTLSLHDALPIFRGAAQLAALPQDQMKELDLPQQLVRLALAARQDHDFDRSEEHTSELQSRGHLVCRLLLEKKKQKTRTAESTRPPSPSNRR